MWLPLVNRYIPSKALKWGAHLWSWNIQGFYFEAGRPSVLTGRRLGRAGRGQQQGARGWARPVGGREGWGGGKRCHPVIPPNNVIPAIRRGSANYSKCAIRLLRIQAPRTPNKLPCNLAAERKSLSCSFLYHIHAGRQKTVCLPLYNIHEINTCKYPIQTQCG